VRVICDEVFGPDNFSGLITFEKTGAQPSDILPSVADYIIWYSKNVSRRKFNQLYLELISKSLSRQSSPADQGRREQHERQVNGGMSIISGA
jgi:adenine specific DNA methylase Mod